MKTCAWRLAALVLVALVSACSNKSDTDSKAGEANSAAEAVASDGANSAAVVPLADRLAKVDALTDLVVAEYAALPRAEFDSGALVAKVGKDPQILFEWVRDRTYWAPYRGLLRGSRGVMLDRVGSSLDRAVLLGDLMRHAGYTVRLAHAELPEARARELLGSVRPIPAQPRAAAASGATSPERQKALAALVPEFENAMAKQTSESKRVTAEAKALVQAQSDALLAATRQAGSANPSSGDDTAVAALRDHWWVEHSAGGKWVAMDVLLPQSKVGESLVAASRVSEWSEESRSPSIPEGDWHSVRIRVVVERYDAGATSESTVLETVLRPAEVLERPITLSHVPTPWPAELPDPGVNPQPFKDAAVAAKLWIPVLRVRDERIIQSGFTNEGEVKTDLESTLGEMGKLGVTTVASGMDMALGGFSPDVAVPAATAEWLDYEIRVPGAEPQRLRRPVFDLLGPARRASKATDFNGEAELRKLERFQALWGPTEILLQTSAFTSEFVAHLASAGPVANQKALKDLARERDPAKAKTLAADLFDRMDIWGPLPSLALWRSSLGETQGYSFIDRPNVLNFRASPAVVDAGPVTYRGLVDIASNSVGIRAGDDEKAFETRLRQGVADTVAEILTLSSDVRMAENTAAVFSRLASEGSRGLLVAANDQAAVGALPWPEDEAMRVGADIGAGFMAVVPRKAVEIDGIQRVGWWRVHPSTGETIGVMDNGYHAMDYAKLTALVATAGAIVNNPAWQQRVQNLTHYASHGARLSPSQLNYIRIYEAARALDTSILLLSGG